MHHEGHILCRACFGKGTTSETVVVCVAKMRQSACGGVGLPRSAAAVIGDGGVRMDLIEDSSGWLHSSWMSIFSRQERLTVIMLVRVYSLSGGLQGGDGMVHRMWKVYGMCCPSSI
jgi:hypothetical protein